MTIGDHIKHHRRPYRISSYVFGVIAAVSFSTVMESNAQNSTNPVNPNNTDSFTVSNAYCVWTGVCDRFVLPTKTNIKVAFDTAYSFNTVLTNKVARAELESWLDSLQVPFDTVSAGIKLGHLRFPPVDLDNLPLKQLSGFRQIARCEIARARLYIEDKEYKKAADTFLDTVQMGQLMLEGNGGIIHYLVGVAIHGMGISGIRAIANNNDVSVETLQFLLANLPDAPDRDKSLANSLHVEESLALGQSLDKLEQGIFSPTNGSPVPPTSNLFNRASTISLLNGIFGRIMANTTNSWISRDKQIESDINKIAGYNTQSDNGFFWDLTMCFGDTNRLNKCWKQIAKKAERTPNVLGKEYVAMIGCGDSVFEKSVRFRTEQNIARTLLALSIYKRRTGKIPEELDDLVSGGVLSHVPLDLFSGKPLLYSAKKSIVWSVGADERNNKGNNDKDIVRSWHHNEDTHR